MRYRDGRSDRGYFLGLGRGVVRVAILRARDAEIEAALPLAIVEAIHFVVDLNQAPLATLSQAAPRVPMPGKAVEVHCASWSMKGTRIQSEEVGFFLVPADLRSNSARVFFPEGAPQLVETSDLPSPPLDDEEEEDGFIDVRTGQLVESRDLGRVSSPSAAQMDLDPFAGSLRSRSAPPLHGATSPLPSLDLVRPDGPLELPGLPPLAALMPPLATPLLPAEVEALLGLRERPGAPPKGDSAGLNFWDDPWAPAAAPPVPRPVTPPPVTPRPAVPRAAAPAPEPLPSFSGSSADAPRMAARVLRPSGDEDEWDIDIESPVPPAGEPSFAFSHRGLLDEK